MQQKETNILWLLQESHKKKENQKEKYKNYLQK